MAPPGQIAFEVRGNPVPQGSHRAFVVPGKNGGKPRAVVTAAAGRDLNDWRHLIRDVAQRHAPPSPWEGPVALRVEFRVQQPKSRPTSVGRGKARHSLVIWPDRRPDLDKLTRGLVDSLTGVYFRDDAQVVSLEVTKDYGIPGASVWAWPVQDWVGAP